MSPCRAREIVKRHLKSLCEQLGGGDSTHAVICYSFEESPESEGVHLAVQSDLPTEDAVEMLSMMDLGGQIIVENELT